MYSSSYIVGTENVKTNIITISNIFQPRSIPDKHKESRPTVALEKKKKKKTLITKRLVVDIALYDLA